MCDVAGNVSVCQCVTSLLAGPLQAKLSSCPAWCSSSAVWPGELAIYTAEEMENVYHIGRFYLTVFNILIFWISSGMYCASQGNRKRWNYHFFQSHFFRKKYIPASDIKIQQILDQSKVSFHSLCFHSSVLDSSKVGSSQKLDENVIYIHIWLFFLSKFWRSLHSFFSLSSSSE